MGLSSELEKAMMKEFKDNMSQFDSSHFDIYGYINNLFPTDETLDNLDNVIDEFDKKIKQCDLDIKDKIKQQAYQNDQIKQELANRDIMKLVNKFESIKRRVDESEQRVRGGIDGSHATSTGVGGASTGYICSEIKSHDNAKRNIMTSISALKNLIMMITAIEQLRNFCIEKKYKDAADLILATEELCSYFKEYENIKEIIDLTQEREHLCNQLRIQLMEEFKMFDKGSAPDQLYEGCFAIDALGVQAVNDVRNWFCSFTLEVYRDTFRVDEENESSKFENTDRRFAWLKRTLKDYTNRFESIFPEEWNLKPMMAYEFCKITKLHLDQILSNHHGEIDITVMIKVLQKTLDFEKYLHRKFLTSKKNRDDDVFVEGDKVEFDVGDADQIREKYSKQSDAMDKDFQFDKDVADKSRKKARVEGKTKISAHIYRFKGAISECFEPYLQGYSETEETKITDALNQASFDDQLEDGEFPFYSSSLMMFAEIKQSINRCTSFSNTKTFLDLHTSFKNVFRYYIKCLKRYVPALQNNQSNVILKEDEELRIAYIVNTCEYCNSMLPALDEHIRNEIEESYKDKVDLENSTETFRVLINQAIQALLNSTETKISEQLAQILKVNWNNCSGVGDNLECVKNINKIVKSVVTLLEPKMNSTYYSYFMNKLCPQVPKLLFETICKIKKCNEEASQQFMLDLLEVRSCILDILKGNTKVNKNLEKFGK